MQPVWVLSVDLQTKTATFQSGLADAARSARGAFTEIRSGSGEMGKHVNYNMMEARHSVMMLGEEFGIHLPRALTSFIASIGPIGAALEAAFPFLAIAVGATILIEHLVKMREAGEKLTADQLNFGVVANNVFNSLDEKIIQAQIRADELRHDHLGALKGALELIERQSMQELVHEFEELDKAADTVFKDLEGHWYKLGIGADGAKHALDEFKREYNKALSAGTPEGDKEAGDLLAGTLKTAQDVLKAQQTIRANRASGGGQTDDSFAAEQTLRAHKASLTVTDAEIAAQEEIVSTLLRQVGVQERVNKLKETNKGNARTSTGNEEAARRAEAARQEAETMQRLGQMSIAADKATADASLAVHHASLEQRLESDIDFAGRERDVKLAANAAEIAALDRSGKDYTNQLKALQEKALEINQDYDTKVAELKARSSVEVYNRDLRDLESYERTQVEMTRKGSAERLQAIEDALTVEEALELQDTNFYRELLNMRAETTRQATEEEAKQREEAAREEADQEEKMGLLALAAYRQRLATWESAGHINDARRISDATRLADMEYGIKKAALDKEIQGLDKSGKDYLNHLKQLQDKEKQLTQQHENEITAIKERAEEERNTRIKDAEDRFNGAIAQGLTQVLMGHQSFAKMMSSLGDQVVSGMIQNALKTILADDMTKERDAAYAARQGFKAGMHFPFPMDLVMAPALAAGAFTAVMAFEKGGIVPGIGTGDTVPAMLTPGEPVLPKNMADRLNRAMEDGDQGNRQTVHVHVRPTYNVQTIDGNGMRAALEKHTDVLQRHFENTLRRMNR